MPLSTNAMPKTRARMPIRPASIRDYMVGALRALERTMAGSRFWDHQKEAVSALTAHFSAWQRDLRGFVVIPTGGGKTAIFTALVDATARHGLESGSDEVPRTILLVPNLVLIGQTLREFRLHHPGVDIGHLSSRKIVDSDGVIYPQYASTITVMTYARFTLLVEAGIVRPQDVDQIIMDEAHRGLSKLRQDIVSRFLGRTAIIAFSATPEFDNYRSLSGLLGAENLAYIADSQRLRDEGVLAPVANYVLAVKIRGDLPLDPRMRSLAKKKAHVDEILAFIERNVDERTGTRPIDKVTIFYGLNRAHAAMFADRYNRRFGVLGKRMALLTGDDSLHQVQAVIAGVNDGSITGIANAMLLTEGFDLPKIGLVVNSPSESAVRIVQQSGRAQRIDHSMPVEDVNQTAFVLDTYFEIDGEMEGHPRWFFESQPDIHTMLVERDALLASTIDVADYVDLQDVEEEVDEEFDGDLDALLLSEAIMRRSVIEHPQDDGALHPQHEAPRPPVQDPDGRHFRGNFTTTQSTHAVHYLLRRRDGFDSAAEWTEEWVPRSAILSSTFNDNGFFDALEDEYIGKRNAGVLGEEPITRAWVDAERRSPPVGIDMDIRRKGIRTSIYYHRDCVRDLVRLSGAALPGWPLEHHWITRRAMIAAVGARAVKVNALLVSCAAAFETEERMSNDPEGVGFDGELVRMRRISSDRGTFIAYHVDDAPLVRRLAEVEHDPMGSDEVSMPGFAKHLGFARANSQIVETFAALKESLMRRETPMVNGVEIAASLRYVANSVVVCIPVESIGRLAEAIGMHKLTPRVNRWETTDDLPHRSAEWLLKDDVFSMLASRYKPDRPLGSLWDRLETAVEIDGIRQVAEGSFRFRLMRSGPRSSVCMHQDDVDRFRALSKDPDAKLPLERLLSLRSRNHEWLTETQLAKALHISPTAPAFTRVWNPLKSAATNGEEPTLKGRPAMVELMKAGSAYSVCIAVSELDRFRAAVEGGRSNRARGERVSLEWRNSNQFVSKDALHSKAIIAELHAAALAAGMADGDDIVLERIPTFPPSERSLEQLAIEEVVPARIRCALKRNYNLTMLFIHKDSWSDMARLTGMPVRLHTDGDEHVHRIDVAKRLGVTRNKKISGVLHRLSASFVAKLRMTGSETPVEMDGETVRCRRVRSGPTFSTWYHASDIDAISRLAGYFIEETERPTEWLDKVAAGKFFRVNTQHNSTFVNFWEALTRACESDTRLVLKGRDLRLSTFWPRQRSTPCLHLDDAPFVADALDFVIEPRPYGWVDKLSLAARAGTGIKSEPFASTWERMVAQRDARQDVILAGKPVQFRKLISGTRTPYCLHESDVAAFIAELGLPDRNVPKKTMEWISLKDFCQIHPSADRKEINRMWALMSAANERDNDFEIEGSPVRVSKLKSGAHLLICVHREDADRIAQHLDSTGCRSRMA